MTALELDNLNTLVLQLATRHADAALAELIAQGEAATESLIAALDSRSERTVRKAVTALADIGDPRAVEPLIRLLRERKAFQDDAIAALARLADDRAIAPLVQAVGYRRSSAAAAALRTFGDGTVEPVLELLQHSDWGVRCLACRALGGKHNAYEMEALLQLALHDKNNHVQREASAALVRIGNSVRERIQFLLNDERAYIRQRAGEIVRLISGEGA